MRRLPTPRNPESHRSHEERRDPPELRRLLRRARPPRRGVERRSCRTATRRCSSPTPAWCSSRTYFTGAATPEFRRAVTVQKCLRVSGKHNDLENVGPSPRHHTFFEMLGNFSFGDYFKAEAIECGWELVTKGWGLPPARLFASVFEQDDEASELWRKISGLPAERIVRCGEKDNFWAMGETGPCGPCSEIFVDRRPSEPLGRLGAGHRLRPLPRDLEPGLHAVRARDATAEARAPLPKPSIDTGAGLERVAAVLAGVDSNYDTDLFQPILAARRRWRARPTAATPRARRLAARRRRPPARHRLPARRRRHPGQRRARLRAAPPAAPRGAARHAARLRGAVPLPPAAARRRGDGRRLPRARRDARRLRGDAPRRGGEVPRHRRGRLADGAGGDRRGEARRLARRSPGAAVFRLYDTYGLPIQLLREIAEEEKFAVDEAGFEARSPSSASRSRAATGDSQKRLGALQGDSGEDSAGLRADRVRRVSTKGFHRRGQVLRGSCASPGDGRLGVLDGVESRLDGPESEGVVVSRSTLFYAEGGGQVGDRGDDLVERRAGAGRRHPEGRRRRLPPLRSRRRRGASGTDSPLTLRVDPEHRLPTQRNHTATHLLHAALRQVLGEGVRQAGSLVRARPPALRLHLRQADDGGGARRRSSGWSTTGCCGRCRRRIVADRPVAEAIAAGAMALFGEKYGERVRTVEVPGFSLELCGGCHVRNTGEIGPFVVASERGVASGVRRIEALTGMAALGYLRGRDEALAAVESALGARNGQRRSSRRRLTEQASEGTRGRAGEAPAPAGFGFRRGGPAASAEVAGIKLLVREVPPAPAAELRKMADALRGEARLGGRGPRRPGRGEGQPGGDGDRGPARRGCRRALLKEIAAVVGGSGRRTGRLRPGRREAAGAAAGGSGRVAGEVARLAAAAAG